MSGADALSVSALADPIPLTSGGGRVESAGVLNGDLQLTSAPNSNNSERSPRPTCGLPSSVIHELRTPLTSIHGYAQVLQRTLQHEPRTANAIAVMTRESARLAGMFALLSELADLESDEPRGEPVAVDVAQLVEGVVEEVQRRDGRAHPVSSSGAAVALCHPQLLSQALLHLLNNAVLYSEPGSPVHVTMAETGTSVDICVADEGIGIDMADLERLFAPFTRGRNAKERGTRGLGLGLYLARQAVEQMHGRLTAESRPGGGTIFRLRLPRA